MFVRSVGFEFYPTFTPRLGAKLFISARRGVRVLRRYGTVPVGSCRYPAVWSVRYVCGFAVGIFSSKPVQSFKALSIFITLSKAIWSPFWGAKLKWDLCRWAGAVARATIPIQIKLICQRWNRNGGNASAQQNSWSFPSAGLPHCCMNFNCNWKWTLNWILLSLTWRLFCWTALICWASSFRGRVEDFCD